MAFLSNLLGLGGGRPRKLPLVNLDPSRIQSQTIQGNIRAEQGAFDLASMANKFSAEELNKELERMLPGYGALRDSATGVIGSELRGEIPKDVERLLTQRAAEKGITLGTSGSGFESSDLLRNLGITSLQITQQGLDSASKWIASIPKAPQFDFTSMFFTPQQRLNFGLQEAQLNTNIRSFNNWADAMPSSFQRGLAGFLDFGENIGSNVLSTWLGSKVAPSAPSSNTMAGGPAYGSTYPGFGGQQYRSMGGYSAPA